MELLILPDVAALAAAGAERVAALLSQRPTAHLCLAAGSSPRPIYEELLRRAAAGSVSLAAARLTQLDEWLGLGPADPASCAADLHAQFVGGLGLRPGQYLGIDGLAPDPGAECRRLAAALAERGPIDLCVLGLGLNGHLGLNEPDESLTPHVHVAALSESSRRHPMLRPGAPAPTHGITLGVEDLLQAERILLPVCGEAKRAALARLLRGPIETRFPASLLRLHRGCLVLADAAAAANLAAL